MLKTRKLVLFIFALMASGTAFGAEYKPGEVIVKYKEGAVRTRSGMNTIYDSIGVESVRRYSGVMKGFEQLVLGESFTVYDAITELQKNSAIEYAQPNYILRAYPVIVEATDEDVSFLPPMASDRPPCWFPGMPFPPGCEEGVESPQLNHGQITPDAKRPELKDAPSEMIPPVVDPSLKKVYGLKAISANNAWKIHQGSKNFIVADIDTGIDYNHEDLAFNLWRNPHPSDKNDVIGFDFVHNDGLPYDDNSHGTHTAGTIGAVGGNGVGISGVIQKVSLMALKFLSGEGGGTTADAIRAIDYAIDHGAKVLSNSWGGKGDPDNKALRDAIERAKTRDVLFIAAAGNEGSDNDGSSPDFPASFDNDNLISVVATDERDGIAGFSNYGKKSTHLGAPGARIYSTVPGDKYRSLSGTSMACPHVAGAAALLWSRHPEWDYKRVKEVLFRSVDQVPSLEGKTLTGGRLNIEKALMSSE